MTAMTLPDATARRRGRVQLLLILGMVLGPMLLATAMYKLQFWVPEGRSYHGDLIATGQTPADLGVQDDKASERWQLLVTAPEACASAGLVDSKASSSGSAAGTRPARTSAISSRAMRSVLSPLPR